MPAPSVFVFYGDFFHNDFFNRSVAEICIYFADFFHNVHAFYHFAENSMMSVKPRSFVKCDEKLGTARIGTICVCHG